MAKKFKKAKEFPYWPSMYLAKRRPSAKGRVITLDMEAIGLVPDVRYNDQTSMHVIHCKDKETGETFAFYDPYEKRDPNAREWLDNEGNQDGYLQDGIAFIQEADVVIAQNILGYDDHAFRKVFPKLYDMAWKAKPRGGKKRRADYPFRVMDTMVMSQLLNPERRPPPQAFALGRGNVGPHTIEAHGIRIGRYKPENEDWTKLTDHMLHRCGEDVEIGEDFYEYLMQEWYEQSDPNSVTGLTIEDAYRMEAVMCWYMQAQEDRGFRLDMHFAWELCGILDTHIEQILRDAMPHMPLRIKKKKLNHTAMRAAAQKAGKEYLLDGEQKQQTGLKSLGFKKDKKNKKLLKAWVKAGGKKKKFIPRRYSPIYQTDEITHGSDRMTNWGFVTQNGNYSANSKKDYPECTMGNINDWKNPVVVGPYTPVVWEEITLGNRDIVRQTLYALGWRGTTPTKGEEEYLEEHGELPYAYAGKLDEESIKAWEKRAEKRSEAVPEWAKDILKYYVVTHRRGQILNKGDMDYYREHGEWPKQQNGKRECRGLVPRARDVSSGLEFQTLMEKFGLKYWDKCKFQKDDEFRVPAAAFAIGTNTFRMRHKYVVNIPSRGLYGKEMRKLFIASKGYLVLGCDGAGLELRMLSHFMKDKEYEDVILNGDIHTYNQDKAKLPERDMAKTFIYAFLYGSGIINLAMVCGVSESEMRKVVDNFLESMPLLNDLIENVKEVARSRGYMKAVDGRLGRVRKSGGKAKEHTALNVLLQMTGSLCMKWGLYFALEAFEKLGIEARLVANVHDEIQMEIPESEVEYLDYKIDKSEWKAEEKKVIHHENGGYYSAPVIMGETKKGKFKIQRTFHKAGDALCKAFEEAGDYLKIRTPLAGEYKIGKSWANTH